MPYREVKVYDRDFPTFDQIYSGDPAVKENWPVEIWMREMQPEQYAVRYKHFQTGNSWGADGKILSDQSAETCRIFDCLKEARAHSRELIKQHPVVTCHLYDSTGKKAGTVFNKKLHWASSFIMLLVGAIFAVLGAGLLSLAYWLTMVVLNRQPRTLLSLGWLGWSVLMVSGFVVAIAAWLAKMWFSTSQMVRRSRQVLAEITPEEKAYYAQMNNLHGSPNPADREKLLKLKQELEQRMAEIRMKIDNE